MEAKKRKITLTLDSALLRKAEVLAARQGLSVSCWMTDQIESLVRQDREYELAQREALALLEEGFDMGWSPPASRDELHER